MLMPDDQPRLCAALYKWSLADWGREIDDGFPFLKFFRDDPTAHAISTLSVLRKEDRRRLVCSLVARTHYLGALECGEPITSEDNQLAEQFMQQSWQAWSSHRAFKENHIVNTANVTQPVLAKAIKQSLDSVCGEREAGSSQRDWRHRTNFGPFSIFTYVDTGGKQKILSYRHAVCFDEYVIMGSLSILSWLGLSAQAIWFRISEAEVPWICQGIAAMCEHFLRAIPELLSYVDIEKLRKKTNSRMH